MFEEYYLYVDEAGDEGFGKLKTPLAVGGQSHWLLLGGIIVRKEIEKELPSWRNELKALVGSKDLHFRKLNHDQKFAVCKALNNKKLGVCVVASNKRTIADSEKKEIFKQKQHLYNYLIRFLLERVTDVCRRATRPPAKASLKVVFSRRQGTDYQKMRDYLCLMRDDLEVVQPVRSIDWSVMDPDNIRVEDHHNRAGLQLADIVTSAVSKGLEPNRFGDIESKYALAFARKFINKNNSIMNEGLTIIPSNYRVHVEDDQRHFIEHLIEKARAPGP